MYLFIRYVLLICIFKINNVLIPVDNTKMMAESTSSKFLDVFCTKSPMRQYFVNFLFVWTELNTMDVPPNKCDLDHSLETKLDSTESQGFTIWKKCSHDYQEIFFCFRERLWNKGVWMWDINKNIPGIHEKNLSQLELIYLIWQIPWEL